MESSYNPPPPFVHLRIHSEFSVVDGIVRIPRLIECVAEFGQPAIALTDLSNMFGLIKFYQNAYRLGIKPIAGCDIWVSNNQDKGRPHRLLLLIRNYEGYLSLCKLLSKAYLDNQYKGRAVVRSEWLYELEGLIVLSGGRLGDIGQVIIGGNVTKAAHLALQWAKLFPGSYYIELQRSGHDLDEVYIQGALQVATKCNLPVVATHPVQFLYPYEFQAHEARVCIAEGETLSNPKRTRRFTQNQYLLSSEKMWKLFSDIPAALENTIEIAKRCNLTLNLGKPNLPKFPTPNGVTLNDHLWCLSKRGLAKRLESLFPDKAELVIQTVKYEERLRTEYNTIISMGFAGYFLIVQDFINWGKKNGVPVGPGRGSGAGSLVAYSLEITDLDPIHYGLLFERFLNPERISMPDFDIDFCQDGREQVIDYVKSKYGREAVSQIVTFGTLGAKAALRDIGRVLDMPYLFCDSLSKLIPFNAAEPWTLSRALEEEQAFKERYEKEEEVRLLIDLGQHLEGLVRNVGMHPGGVLIAPGKLTDFCPLYCQLGQENNVVSQFDKDDIEAIGLVKFDFLGLRNLTILDRTVKYINKLGKRTQDFHLTQIPLDDRLAYKVLCEGNTTAIFQLESRGMKELLGKLKPSRFEDIIAVLALYRPGPLESGMVEDFVNRKHGQVADYFHPDLQAVLENTYGVIVYQEQVMLIAQIIGGYSLGSADLLRRAMSKKKQGEMAKHRKVFERGAIANGYDSDLAVRLFDLIEKFAGYGFNKSHSAAYALIVYQTAWLKAHYPAEFFAASLSSDMDNTEKIRLLRQDVLKNGLQILPPNINNSVHHFEPITKIKEGIVQYSLTYGLGALKGAGRAAIENILEARRANGPFRSLFDFCQRIDRNIVNRRTIETLIKAGAFDSIESNRAAMIVSVNIAIDAAERKHCYANQMVLFNDDSQTAIEATLAKVQPWGIYVRLTEEKSALGYYFSGHLFDAWHQEVRRVAPVSLLCLQQKPDSQFLSGIVDSVRSIKTRRGKILIVTLDDSTGQVEVLISDELYRAHRNFLRQNSLLIVKGKVTSSNYSEGMRVVADALYDLQLARRILADTLCITLKSDAGKNHLRELLDVSRADTNDTVQGLPINIHYSNSSFSCIVRLGPKWRVHVAESLFKNFAAHSDLYDLEVTY